ncbi:hypothetical protein GM661_16650 [Iocasia frigidifontis]|uniref:Sulfotransferase n=1 Tax=Iocasia fonsfrigidae TaxID=2682810 RepID=A0A8A7KI43_9FIRM|nr:hypothetical protein [Iocasia fonsfrigidae]QTL99458.1 hypothetical protein GM661_16650 [Iocasia fonsfrigidae]
MGDCVIVLGMHRSGTSMIAGILDRLGINMGDNLIGAMPSNPYGHYEDKEFVELNDRILHAAGGFWYNPPGREALLEKQNTFKDDILSLVQKINDSSKYCGWKDPRTSLTIELFYPYLTAPKFIVCHRAAVQVANSLQKRSGIPLEVGINLKREYDVRLADFFTRNKDLPKIDLYYNDVLENTRERISSIVDFLVIKPSSAQLKEAEGFVVVK